MLTHVWLIPAIPALSFVLILAFGKRLPKGGSEIGIAAVAIAFVLALAVGVGWIQRVNHPPEASHPTEEAVAGHEGEARSRGRRSRRARGRGPRRGGWRGGRGGRRGGAPRDAAGRPQDHLDRAGAMGSPEDVTVGTMVDGLSALMLLVVTIVSLLVHVYSTDYVAGDRRYTHFFAFLSLFTASMLFFVLSQSTLQMIVGWELVGLCSFALIGHWWEEKPNSDAALKAFLTNRVGDVGLLVGMITLYFAAGRSFDIIKINEMATAGEIRHLLLLVASCCLMAAVMSKSGQFILHTWLPDAMAGPTPVSALIHAATMVVAGIYMIARLYGVFWHGLQIGELEHQRDGGHRCGHRRVRRAAGLRAERHQEGARLLDDQPARLHGDGPRRRRLDRGDLPPLHPRLLQGLPLPRRRLAQPRRATAST